MRYLSLIGFLLCCQSLNDAIGLTKEIMVVTESEEVFNSLERAIQMVYHLPRREKKYHIIQIGPDRFKDILKFHLIIIAEPLNRGEIGRIIETLLAPDAEEIIKRDSFGIFITKDQWAKSQEVVVITGLDDSSLLSGIRRASFRIRALINEHYFNRIGRATFFGGEDEDLERYLFENYSIRIRIPKGYRLEERYRKDNFIYLHRHAPDRIVFIAKILRKDSITIDWILNQRDILTLLYYDGDYTYRDLCFGGWTEINDREVFKVYGVWQNESLAIGGPFVSILYPGPDWCYLIDGMVYAPGENKLPYLNSLEFIVSSFQRLDTVKPSTIID